MKNRIWSLPVVIFGIVLLVVNGCKKEDNAPSNIIKDIDGNVYNTVTIGTQVWMLENLKTTKFNDNTDIPLVTDTVEWAALSTPAYCCYNNDDSVLKATYGSLYNAYTVNAGKLCPTGWHVPTDEEWKVLEMYLGMTHIEADNLDGRGADQGIKLKSTSGWNSGGNGTNTSGFTALPGGFRNINGEFYGIGRFGYWWSASESSINRSWFRLVDYDINGVVRGERDNVLGFSVRCVRD